MNNVAANVISRISKEITIRKRPVKALIPCAIECLQDALKATVGIIATPFSAITCGKFKTLNQCGDLTSNGKEILPKIFKAAMKVLNPSYVEKEPMKSGVFTYFVSKKFRNKTPKLRWSNSWFDRNITLRTLHTVAIPVLTITRIADGLLAIPVTATSILYMGSYPDINAFASTQIRSFSGIFSDISSHLRGAFNPRSVTILGKSINI